MTRGFTLLEMIIATIIFAMIIGAAYSLFDSSRGVSETGEAKAQLLQEARSAMRMIRTDLEGAWGSGTSYDTGFIGTSSGGQNEPLCTLDLVSVNNSTPLYTTTLNPKLVGSTPLGEIDLTHTNYQINPEASSTKPGLVRQKTKQLLATNQVQTGDDMLDQVAPDAIYVKFQYWDGTQQSWVDTWDSTVSGYLPKAIQVTLYLKTTFRDKDVIEKYVEKLYLPIAAEIPAKSTTSKGTTK